MIKINRYSLVVLLVLISCRIIFAEDGYRLWLRYDLIKNDNLLENYKSAVTFVCIKGNSKTISIAEEELNSGLTGLLGSELKIVDEPDKEGTLFIAPAKDLPLTLVNEFKEKLNKIGPEGFIISKVKMNGFNTTVITANSDIGILYGVFGFLRQLQTGCDITEIQIQSFLLQGIAHFFL